MVDTLNLSVYYCVRMGRPSKYSDKLALAICKRIAEGESLIKVCKSPEMPHKSTVIRWTLTIDDFHDHYARAREIQAELMADEITDIADSENGDVQRDRLKVDTRKWYLSHVLPKKYGDKKAIEITGENGGPVQIVYDKSFDGL